MKICSLMLLFLLAVGCTKGEHDNANTVKEVNVDEIPEDIRIPIKLWDRIEQDSQISDLVPKGKEEEKNQEQEKDEFAANKGTILFSPITVILKEHNSEVLESPEIKISLPRGGGQVDLSDYVGSKVGSFFVKFVWPEEWKDVTSIQSYYVSRGRKRKLDGDTYGVGCNKYLNLTKQLLKENAGEGIKVNTTRDRHTTVLGGHFIFSGKKGSQTFLSQVTFLDKKNPHLLCESKKSI